MMKKMRNICATILTVAVVYLITINTTIISYAETEVETISIPVILNYTGDAWVDQNGNLMNMETAENFLNNNPDYTRRILSLNQNAQYAAALQNETRSEVIEEFEIYSSKWQSGAYHNCDMLTYVSILEEFIADPPTKEAFDKLFTHLQNNVARYDVKWLQDFCQTGHNSITDVQASTTASYLFYGMLAKNYDSEYVDEACNMAIMGTTSPQIPAILLADQETWLDQNGEIMDQERAEYFLRHNKNYARDIVQTNLNPHYLPWRNGIDDDLIDQLWDKYSLSPNSYTARHAIILTTEYTWAVQDILSAPPSTEILECYRDQLKPNAAANNISRLISYINGLGCKPNESDTPDYIFWSAVAKAIENGNLEVEFESMVAQFSL